MMSNLRNAIYAKLYFDARVETAALFAKGQFY